MRRDGEHSRRAEPRKATDVDEAVGRQIRKRRRMLGISQAELADAVGIASQQIQKYEIGANRLSVSRLVEIAAILSVPIGWFFRGMEGPEQSRGEGLTLADQHAISALISTLAKPSERSKLFAIAELIAAQSNARQSNAELVMRQHVAVRPALAPGRKR